MKKEDLLRKTAALFPDEFKIACDVLGEEYITERAQQHIDGTVQLFDDFGLSFSEGQDEEGFMNILMNQVSKKILEPITEEQADTMINAMRAVGAVSVQLLDGKRYTISGIEKFWKKRNEEVEEYEGEDE